MRRIAIAVALVVLGFVAPARAAETYLNLAKIAADPGFQQRVAFAMESAAQNVYSEASGASAYFTRHAFTIRVMAGSYSIPSAALAVVANATVSGEANILTNAATSGYAIPDADIATALAGAFNALAGF